MFYTDAADKTATQPWHCPRWCTVSLEYHEDETTVPDGFLHRTPVWTERGIGTVEAQILEGADGSVIEHGSYVILEVDALTVERSRAIAAALVKAADLAEQLS